MKPTDGRRGNRPGPRAHPTVRRVELDADLAIIIRNACQVRYGTASKADVTQYVNDTLRQALRRADAA